MAEARATTTRQSARATTPKEWALAVAGGLGLSAVLVMWLRPEILSPPDTPAMVAPAIVVLQAPAPNPVSVPQEALPALLLRGIMQNGAGGSAIIEAADGRQRLVSSGRMVSPGWRLAGLTATSATLVADSGDETLLLLDGEVGDGTAASEALTGPLRATPAALATSSNSYRLALKATRKGSEIIGFAVQDPASIPLFRLAGLTRGDVLISLNGQAVSSEEKVIELPAEVAGAKAIDLEVDSGGQKRMVHIDLIR